MEKILLHFPELTQDQIQQFSALGELYNYWNEKINVVSRKDIEELYTKHVLHSLAIGRFITFRNGTEILDVGTGGGFPGIPLAILFPDVNFHLVDSIQKKILVVSEVTNALGLKNVQAQTKRAEEITTKYDFVVSRAVTQMPQFVDWVKGKFKLENKNSIPNGIIYLKGGDLIEELLPFPQAEILSISAYFPEEFFETKKIVYLSSKFL